MHPNSPKGTQTVFMSGRGQPQTNPHCLGMTAYPSASEESLQRRETSVSASF